MVGYVLFCSQKSGPTWCHLSPRGNRCHTRQKRLVKPTDFSGRLCAFYLNWLWHKTDRSQPSATVGYVRSVMSRSGLWQKATLIHITDRLITDRLLMNTVGFLGFMWWARSVIVECGRFSGINMVKSGRFWDHSVGFTGWIFKKIAAESAVSNQFPVPKPYQPNNQTKHPKQPNITKYQQQNWTKPF